MGTSQPERVLGRYVLFREIASGGMASVHLGRLLGPVGFSRVVAIKRLHPHLARDPEFVTMFIDEARLAARISHPNVVPTLDVVALEGELFIVMEYVEGESLARLVKLARAADQKLPLPVINAIIVSTLLGLHAAHEARGEGGRVLGIVHRDISPQNILVGVEGLVRVVDFGIAMAQGRDHRTASGVLKGKLRYMAPEQILLEAVDRRTDVYAASVVMWELLTGRTLFKGESDFLLAEQIRKGVTTPPSELNPEVPKELDEIVMRGCSTKPKSRYATAADMAEAIIASQPCAIAGTIGRLVQSLASESISRRRQLLEQAESLPRDETPSFDAESGSDVASHIQRPWVDEEADDDRLTSVRDEPTSLDESLTLAKGDISAGGSPPPVATVAKTRPGGAFRKSTLEPTQPRMSAELAEDAASATRATWSVAGLTRRISTPVWGMIVGGVLALIIIVSIVSIRARDKANQPDVLAVPASASLEPGVSISSWSSKGPATTPAPAIASQATATPSAHSTTRAHAMSKAAAPASAKPTSKAKDPCVPPWYIDKNGDKRFRTECL
jgi:serine/threonine protein kinase